VLFAGCKDDDPTIFEGKVVYADGEAPYSEGKVHIALYGHWPLADVLKRKDIELDDTGKFSAQLEHNDDGRYCIIGITPNDRVVNPYTEATGLDCSPFNCDEFEPGKSYKNLVLKVPRE